MRTRNKYTSTDLKTFSTRSGLTTYLPCSGTGGSVSGAFTSGSYQLGFESERMSDSLGKATPHAVVHRKYRQVCKYPTGNSKFPASFGYGIGYGYVDKADQGQNWAINAMSSLGSHQWDVSSNTTLPPYWSVDMGSINESVIKNDLLERANQLKADVLLNIVEANQIVPSITSLANSLPSMAANWKSIRKVIRTAAGSYLAWKFGVSPILSDIMAIQRHMPRLKEAIKRHGEQAKSRFSTKVVVSMSLSPSPYANGYYPIGGVNCLKWYWQGRVLETPHVRYVLVVKPSTKYHTDFFKRADYFASRFSTSPASLAWELVPFSFVLDWFVDLRGTLGMLDKLIGVEPYEVVSFTKSFSYATATDVFLDVNSPCGGSLGSISSTHECKHYERSLVSGSALPNWKPRFGKNQAAISAALISQALSGTRSKRVIGNAVNSFNKAVDSVIR